MPMSNELKTAKRMIALQKQAISSLDALLTADFEMSVQSVLHAERVHRGRLIVSGIGKSGLIARKTVATLNSTGTKAIFMHASDALHGDLGMIAKDDIVMLISNSGDSAEIRAFVNCIAKLGNMLIAVTGNTKSYLGNKAKYVLCSHVEQEDCIHNIVPTCSTTAQVVLTDAFAICLMEARQFTVDDFAKSHPGGSLGALLG